MIEVEGLRKSYGDFVAVDGVSFTAQPGKIFGLLGPNGAGKSTSIGCISGLLKPTDGRIRVNGHDVVGDGQAAKAGLGVVPQELSLYEEVSATENLLFWGAAYGMRGSELDQSRARRARLHRPARPRRGTREELQRGHEAPHQLRLRHHASAEGAAARRTHRRRGSPVSRSALRNGQGAGRARHGGPLHDALHGGGGAALRRAGHRRPRQAHRRRDARGAARHGRREGHPALGRILRLRTKTRAALSSLPDVQVVVAERESIRLTVADASRRLPELFEAITRVGGEVRETTLSQPSLETLFLKLTGKELRK